MKDLIILINMLGNIEIADIEKHIENNFLKIKKQNPLLLLEPREHKIYKMYERDMNIIANSLIYFSNSNPTLSGKMKKLIGDEIDTDIQINKLNLILYKNSLIK